MRSINILLGMSMLLPAASCKLPGTSVKSAQNVLPSAWEQAGDTNNVASIRWRDFFNDPLLVSLIDTALQKNRELQIMTQEIAILKNEVMARKGEYLPFVSPFAGAGTEKVGRYTSRGANDALTDIVPGKKTPDPLGDLRIGLSASWELDVWKKLRNAKMAAAERYLAGIEGKNFMVTQVVAEIASSYYELLALDNRVIILKNNIEIQQNALETVKQQKEAARATELAVKKFEAEVLRNRALLFELQQAITETENRINFLVGVSARKVPRNTASFQTLKPGLMPGGLPSQLLQNRPDIRMAEHMLKAAGLDVLSARAQFLPSFRMTAGLGFQAFRAQYLLHTPESMLFNLAGDMVAPLVNRRAIQAAYANASARQVQRVCEYEQVVLRAYNEVANLLSRMNNLGNSMDNKNAQVDALNSSVEIAGTLFTSARADYMEVLMTQRDALEARFELAETRMQQMQAMVGLYRSLGGGWR